MRGLDGKVAIITGAARGMGRAAAERLVAEGAKVLMTDVLAEVGKQAADEIGDAATFTTHDVSDEDAWVEVVALAEREHGRLDILVNNAGILSMAPVDQLEKPEYERLLSVNQFGPYLGMKHAIPAMRRSGGGSIVNISSVEGMGGGQFLSAYSGTKFAVRGMTKSVAWEVGVDNIRVNSVHPGAIRTDMIGAQGGLTDDGVKFMNSKTALKRMGEAEEVAALVAFLASDDSSYVTGAEFVVDGGVTAHSGFAI